MAETSSIEWTDATWNPLTGCTPIGAGCKHCYASRLAGTRLKHHPTRAGLTRQNADGEHVWTGTVRFNAETLNQLRHWRKPRRVFVCAHSDLFHESVTPEQHMLIFRAMQDAPQHCYQILTKRHARMTEVARWLRDHGYLPPHIWWGASASNQAEFSDSWRHLREIRGRKFLSLEPLLGPIDLTEALWVTEECEYVGSPRQMLDLVIVGGESGPNARPMAPEWARKLRDDCAASGVPFMFKQWGAYAPWLEERCSVFDPVTKDFRDLAPRTVMERVSKRASGRLLDGVEHMPEVDWWAEANGSD